MASSLAAQLAKIRRDPDRAQVSVKQGLASVLFEPRQAADYDLDTVYSVALGGFVELVKLDRRFV
jgi:U3 small nucleolar RNA-associated protein 10